MAIMMTAGMEHGAAHGGGHRRQSLRVSPLDCRQAPAAPLHHRECRTPRSPHNWPLTDKDERQYKLAHATQQVATLDEHILAHQRAKWGERHRERVGVTRAGRAPKSAGGTRFPRLPRHSHAQQRTPVSTLLRGREQSCRKSAGTV
jgi:hypothetical protein